MVDCFVEEGQGDGPVPRRSGLWGVVASVFGFIVEQLSHCNLSGYCWVALSEDPVMTAWLVSGDMDSELT